MDIDQIRGFLAWNKQRKFVELWERTHTVYATQRPTVTTATRPWGAIPVIDMRSGARALCNADRRPKDWGRCKITAGLSTHHPGTGWCASHLGNSRPGNTEGFLIMAHAFAQKFGTTPAQALQDELDRTAGGVRWLDEKVATAVNDDDLLPGGALGDYVVWRERERSHLIKVAVAAINGGVSQLIAEQLRIDGEQIARIMTGALTALDLEPAQENRLREILARQLVEIGAMEEQ